MRAKKVTGNGVGMGKGTAGRMRALRLLAIGLCFVTVFALTLAFGSGLIGTPDVSGNVAVAVDQNTTQQDGEQTAWTASGIVGNNGNITAATFGFPGTSSKNSWTFTETFTTHTPSTTSQSLYKQNGNTQMFGYINTNDEWLVGVTNGYAQYDQAWCINYSLPTFIINLQNNDNFTVKMTASLKWLNNDSMGTFYIYAKGSQNTMQANEVYADTANRKSVAGKDNTRYSATEVEIKATKQSSGVRQPMNYLTVGIECHQEWTAGSSKKFVHFGGLQIKIDITYNGVKHSDVDGSADGAAPVWGKDWHFTDSAQYDYTSPVRTSAASAGSGTNEWPVYDVDQLGEANYPLDDDSTGKYMSYQGKSLGTASIDGSSYSYYKYTQLTVIDAYNFAQGMAFMYDAMHENWSDAQKSMGLSKNTIGTDKLSASLMAWNSSTYDYAVGIKNIRFTIETDDGFGEVTFTATALKTTTKKLTVTGSSGTQVVGGVEIVDRAANDHGCYTIKIYMFANATLEIEATDYGDLTSSTKRLQYGGIDPVAPKQPTLTDADEAGYFYTGAKNEQNVWAKTANVSATLTTAEDDLVSAPSFYYFQIINLSNGGSVPEPEAKLTWADFKDKSKTEWQISAILTPALAEDGLSFSYNFSTGKLVAGGKQTTPYGRYTTGAGAYLFRLYAFDMAGNNASQCFDFYINVDYVQPSYDAEIAYGGSGELKITSRDNGKWATSGDVSLEITPKLLQEGSDGVYDNGFSISGNTLTFENDGRTYWISLPSGVTTSFGDVQSNGTPGNGVVRFTGLKSDLGKDFGIKVEVKNGKFILTFTGADGTGECPDMEWTSEFKLLAGSYNTGTDPALFDETLSYTDGAWAGGINIRIDKNAPTGLTINGLPEEAGQIHEATEGGKLNFEELENAALTPALRNWYHVRYLCAHVTLIDDLFATYPSEYKVNFAIKGIDDFAALKAFEEIDILELYKQINDQNAVAQGMNKFTVKTGEDFDNSTDLDVIADSDGGVDLMTAATATAGIRLVFVWVTDQAGNCSDLSVYYVFADWSDYRLSAKIGSSDKLAKDTASIAIPDTTFKRGDEITVTMSVNDGYAPYKLALGEGDLLVNYGADKNGFKLATKELQDLLTGFDEVAGSTITATYKFDSLDFDSISEAERTLYFKHRQVVEYSVAQNSTVTYKAASVVAKDLTIPLQNITDTKLTESVLEAFRLKFVDEEGNPLYVKNGEPRNSTSLPEEALTDENGAPVPFAAINVGDYTAYVFIPYDDETFVAKTTQVDDSGEQTLTDDDKKTITVRAKQLYVIPEEGNAPYASSIELKFGLFEDEQGENAYVLPEEEGEAKGFLKLDGVTGWAAESSSYSGAIAVGSYRISVNGEAFAITDNSNYTLSFVENKRFEITQREMDITLLGATKAFGDPDPIFEFGIKNDTGLDDAIFKALLTVMFGSEGTERDGYFVYQSPAIFRRGGEDAGAYDFVQDADRIQVDPNFKLNVVSEGNGQLVISKRTVKIAVTGSKSLKYGEEFDRASAKLGYRSADIKDEIELVKQELEKLIVEGTLVLGEDPTDESEFDSIKYSKVQYYTITLGDVESDNVEVVLDSEHGGDRYYVYTAAQDVITVSLKDIRDVLSMVYGTQWQPTTTFRFASVSTKFDVRKNGDPVTVTGNNVSVSWEITIEGYEAGSYIPVGTYAAKITKFVIYRAAEPDNAAFIADDITVEVTPAEIVIAPTFQNTSRVYGAEDDGVYGFGFEISSINGAAVPEGGFAGMQIDDIKSKVKFGTAFTFARAAYRDGARVASGARTDYATNAATHRTPDGIYYLPEVIGNVQIDDSNFTIKANIANDKYLDIAPFELTLDLAGIRGLSKDYDGTLNALYKGNKLISEGMGLTVAYDIAAQLWFADEAELAFDAVYSALGDPTKVDPTKVTITFSKFTLTGAAASNYTLAKIKNSVSGNGATASVGDLSEEHKLEEGELASLTVTIQLIDNSKDISEEEVTNYIYISAGAIGVWKDDLSASKVYDGTLRFTEKDVSIKNRFSDDTTQASPYLLTLASSVQVLDSLDGNIVNEFADANVGETKYISLALFFTFDDISNLNLITIANNSEDERFADYHNDPDVSVSVYSIGGKQGILVQISNFAASVTKREINGDSFSEITAVARAYNALRTVGVKYVLKDNAVVAGDDLSLSLTGLTDNANAGKHPVTLDVVGEVNSNYSVNIASIREKFNEVEVEIAKAELVPFIQFKDMEYAASELIDGKFYTFVGHFTTLMFGEELEKELENLTFDIEKVSLLLSNGGKIDPNVIMDPITKEETMHPVLVRGIKLVVGEGIDLNNYKLAFGCYDEDGNAIDQKEITLEDGADIPDIELTDEYAIKLLKAPLQIMDNNVVVKDKVYDGTTAATIAVSLPQNMPEADKEYIQLTAVGSFKNRNVGVNIGVIIVEGSASMSLTPKGEEVKGKGLLDNYYIKYTQSTFQGNIVERPVTVEASLGEQVYSGSAAIDAVNITYTFDENMLATDRVHYNVQSRLGAFYDDKNVAFENGKEANKSGSVYDPALRDSTSVVGSNYKLVQKFDEAKEGLTLYAVRLSDGRILLAKDYYEEFPITEGAGDTPSEAYVAEDGPASGTPETPSAPDVTVETYYYELDSSAYFAKVKGSGAISEENKSSIKADDGFVGYIEFGGEAYWIVTESYGVAHPEYCMTVEALGTVSYIRSVGKLTRRVVSLQSAAVSVVQGSKAFSKEYDGTVKFFGTLGTDFTCNSNALSGKVDGDDLTIDKLNGVFNSANTTASKVVFTGVLAGSDAANYVLDEARSSASVNARISKRKVYALLEDGEMTYGTVIGSIVGDIKYSLDDAQSKQLINDGNNFYIELYSYLAVLGFANEGATVLKDALADQKYVDELIKDSLFEYKEGAYVSVSYASEADIPDGKRTTTFIKLSGEFYSLPQARAQFGVSTPAVGDPVRRYYLTSGNAVNFDFVAKYTGNTPIPRADSSNLVVVPKDVYVSATRNDLSIRYGDPIPSGAGRIAFYDGDGIAYSFASGASYGSLFVRNGVDYGPVMKWQEYDPVLDRERTVDGYLGITNSERMYVARFVMPSGADYANGTVNGGSVSLNANIKNYRFHFGHIEYKDGEYFISYTYEFSEDGSELKQDGDLVDGVGFYKSYTSTLTVSEPEITGITVQDGQSFPYGTKDRNGTNDLLSLIVSGTLAGDRIAMVDSSGSGFNVSAAKTYKGRIRIIRTIKWDDGDQGHDVTYITPDEYTLIITRGTPGIVVEDDSTIYNGETYVYDIANMIKTDLRGGKLNSSHFDVTVLKLVGATYYPAYGLRENGTVVPLLKDGDNYFTLDSRGNRIDWTDSTYKYEMKDVGTYRFDMTTNDNFVRYTYDNYEKVTVSAYITITRREVRIKNIKIDGDAQTLIDSQGNYVFQGTFDPNKAYEVTYDVETLSVGIAEDSPAIVRKTDTSVIGLEEVGSAGRYAFRITITASRFDPANYSFTEANGLLELTQNAFTSDGANGSTSNDSMTFAPQEGVIANKLVVRHIKSTGGSAIDLDLWNKVNAYMPSISSDAKLAGIVQVRLFYGDTQVNTTGKNMELTIKLPEGVDRDLNNVVIYVKNRQGGLEKLSDYKLIAGSINYVTDYLGEIVFVDISTNNYPSWLMWTVIAVAAVVALFVLWVVGAFVVRKVRLKKLI